MLVCQSNTTHHLDLCAVLIFFQAQENGEICFALHFLRMKSVLLLSWAVAENFSRQECILVFFNGEIIICIKKPLIKNSHFYSDSMEDNFKLKICIIPGVYCFRNSANVVAAADIMR